MEARFKPRFLKDLERVRKDAEVLTALAHIISQVKRAVGIAQLTVIPVEIEPLEALRPVHEGGLGEEVGFVGHGRGSGSKAKAICELLVRV